MSRLQTMNGYASHTSLPRNQGIMTRLSRRKRNLWSTRRMGWSYRQTWPPFSRNRLGPSQLAKKLKSKLELYKRPANCKVLTAPLTNKEIWHTDDVQKNMAKATIAMAKCVDELALCADYKDKLTNLTDAMTLLGHTHKSITNLRRELMSYALLYDFKSLCDTTTEASNTLLYGDDNRQNLKDAKEQRRLTASLQVQQDNKYRRPSHTSGPFLGRRGRGRANLSARPLAPRYKMPCSIRAMSG
ncbi:hypothetical protein ElyMa_003567700 [Elysia marginata]|uniref:Uncharacterized protein n=1 Tax=Elysia marginata TaxID=1093978 RepID=A0AAV4EML0_9GAST|nr:hypothetical protein ElyMa_003567700 [Elysia marginata]